MQTFLAVFLPPYMPLPLARPGQATITSALAGGGVNVQGPNGGSVNFLVQYTGRRRCGYH